MLYQLSYHRGSDAVLPSDRRNVKDCEWLGLPYLRSSEL